jgi:hypothetical protein
MKAKAVIHNIDLSLPFTINTRVRQGCLLSPLIFSILIDWVMKAVVDQPRGIQLTLTSKLEDLDFADDIGLISYSCAHVQANTNRLKQISRATGLETNISKTKSLRTNHTQTAPITINGRSIDVERFTCLGSFVNKTGGTDEDVKARISKARHTFVLLKPV